MEIRLLRDIATITAGADLKRLQVFRDREAFPILTPKDVGRSLAPLDTLSKVEASRTEIARYRIQPGDIVVTTRGTDIRAAVAQGAHDGVAIGANLVAIRPDSVIAPALLAAFLCDPLTRGQLLRHTAGTSTPGFTIKTLGALPIRIPPLGRQRLLVSFIVAVEAHREALLQAIQLREQACAHLIADELLPSEAVDG
jgi:restriction endonuclease S subunit